jgi:hypothetical protein
LVVRGPKRAKAIGMELIQHKAAVMAALGALKATSVGTTSTTSAPCEPVPCRIEKAEGTKHATITFGDKTYELRQSRGMWFFRLTPDAGWTCCSPEFVEIIERSQALSGNSEASYLLR